MKRKALLAHLRQHGCEEVREGSRHSWWRNSDNTRRSAIPRHTEINDLLARKICKDLGVEQPA
jgi:mRNA interferase HicA